MAKINEKQADVIEGALVLANARGTAPGQRVDADGQDARASPRSARRR